MTSEPHPPEHFLRALHNSGWQGCLAVTGGGASALSELLAVPGGSRTLLSGAVPYSQPALIHWLGVRPEQFCSPEAALAMAVRAYEQALKFRDETTSPNLFGVACTASLVSDRPKKGPHRCYVALQTADGTLLRHLLLDKDTRTRREEEAVVSRLILNTLAEAVGLSDRCDPQLRPAETVVSQNSSPDPILADLWNGRRNTAWVDSQGRLVAAQSPLAGAVLCGSFNPLHEAHRELRRVAQEFLGLTVGYELSVANVEKPSLDYLTIERRIRQFPPAPAVITRAPHFYEKAAQFPGLWFVVGMDTAERILDLRFNDGSDEVLRGHLANIKRIGCRVLVAGRLEQDRFHTRADLNVPPEFADLFVELPESLFRIDLSSTQLRQANHSSSAE